MAALMAVLIVSGTVTARQMTGPVKIGTPEQRSRDAHALIYLTVVAIEDFRDVNGQLPRTPDQIG